MAAINEYYLFIYCEWLNDEIVKEQYPTAVKITKGISEDKAVRFVSYKDDFGNPFEGGCCAVGVSGEVIYGTVWKLGAKEIAHLDNVVNVNEGRYTRLYQAVKGDDGNSYACISHSVKHPIDFHSHPSKDYLDNMLKGARFNNFPKEYIHKLEALA